MAKTRAEIALEILLALIAKSGVREYEDLDAAAKMTARAILMAEAIDVGGVAQPQEPSMANEFYIKHGAEISFGSEVGDDVAWSSESISNGAGRQSAFYDQGAPTTARPGFWEYRIMTQAVATPTLKAQLRMYLKTSDGTYPDNDDGTGDIAVSAEDKLTNLELINGPLVDEAAANIQFVSKGVVFIPHRYFGVVGWNAMGSAVTSDEAETKALFTPIFWQQQ